MNTGLYYYHQTSWNIMQLAHKLAHKKSFPTGNSTNPLLTSFRFRSNSIIEGVLSPGVLTEREVPVLNDRASSYYRKNTSSRFGEGVFLFIDNYTFSDAILCIASTIFLVSEINPSTAGLDISFLSAVACSRSD